MKENDIEIRSEEIIDFMSYTPTWLIKWGITVIFTIIVIIILLSSIIRYPETLKGQIAITTLNPTITIINKVSGRIEKLMLKDDAMVKAGDVITSIESQGNSQDIITLRNVLNTIDPLKRPLEDNLQLFKDSLNLGDFQAEYTQLISDLRHLKELRANPFYTDKIKIIEKQLRNQDEMMGVNSEVLKLSEKDMDNAIKKNNVYKKLFEEKVIPPLEFQEKQEEFSRKQQEFVNLKRNVIQTNITIEDLKKQKIELQNDFRIQQNQLAQSILQKKNNLINAIIGWQKNYIVKTYSAGKLKYIQNLTDNQYLKQGEPLFLVVPEKSQYMGITFMSAYNSGKLKVGQKALISLESYSDKDFGKLVGTVHKIFSVPNQNSYTVQIILNKGLVSSLKKNIPFKPQMTGTVEIIVDNTTIIQRILKKLNLLYSDYSLSA